MNVLHNVDYYAPMTGEITVYFPNGKKVCQYCIYLKEEYGLRRFLCLLTHEYVLNPFSKRGVECPLKEVTEDE